MINAQINHLGLFMGRQTIGLANVAFEKVTFIYDHSQFAKHVFLLPKQTLKACKRLALSSGIKFKDHI
jgi:hypothetical protein